LVGLALVCATASAADPPTLVPRWKNDRWMTEIAKAYPKYRDLELGQVILPGAHDAGASFPLSVGFAPDMSPALNVFLTPLLATGFSLDAVHFWSTAQSGGVTSQLEAGVRYFDLRVCAPPWFETEPRFCHGFYGPSTVDQALEEVNDFLAQPGR